LSVHEGKNKTQVHNNIIVFPLDPPYLKNGNLRYLTSESSDKALTFQKVLQSILVLV